MKARFQIFKAPFYFVGWLAPAYGKDEVNPNRITFYSMHHICSTEYNLTVFVMVFVTVFDHFPSESMSPNLRVS